MKVRISWVSLYGSLTGEEFSRRIDFLAGLHNHATAATHSGSPALYERFYELELNSAGVDKLSFIGEHLKRLLRQEFDLEGDITIEASFPEMVSLIDQSQRRKTAMEDAIGMLRDTRRWLKDKRFASIRQRLQKDLY